MIEYGLKVVCMEIKKLATFDLYLHDGKAPKWLLEKMRKLGKAIFDVMLLEFDHKDVLSRLADPIWFQALSYVLGYDWDSSGVTTVLTGVLRDIFNPDIGIMVAGGKGKKAISAPRDIRKIGEVFGFSERKINELIRISRLVAKVDNAIIQDSHQLYHHTMIISKHGDWIVVQQGMNPDLKTARRYHWASERLSSFVIEPHKGIIGHIKLPFVLNMASRKSLEGQKISVDIVNEGIPRIRKDLSLLINKIRAMPKLTDFFNDEKRDVKIDLKVKLKSINIKIIRERLNWRALKRAYELSPRNYEELISTRGIGPSTVRALALIAELIYGAEVSWIDPIRYTFTVGGKDGVPYPVNLKRMEEISEFLISIIEDAKLGRKDKLELLKRLSKISSRSLARW